MKKLAGILTLLCIIAVACTPTPTPAPATKPPVVAANGTPAPDGMALIPAGAFKMGSTTDQAMTECKKFRADCEAAWYAVEEPVHTVDLPAFYMDIYEVTNVAYRACETAGTCKTPHFTTSATHPDYYTNTQYDNYPVINVNWDNAKTFCEWRGGRLPSEAEWEKAARGTDGRTYPWGEGLDTTHANFADSKTGDPVAVGSYESGKSPYGLYDMTGNVWEWVADWLEAYPGGDPAASPAFGQKARGLRGGAWFDPGNSIHAAFRGMLDPVQSFGNIGFRCARDAQ